MTGKRKLNYDYKRLKKIKSKYLLILAVLFLALGIHGLRKNYSEMVRLRTAVVTADQQNGDVETALDNLRVFVYGHMNTNLASGNISIKPPIQLKYRYERLSKKEQKEADKINKDVKKKGEQVCLKQNPGALFNSDRVNCVSRYISDHSVKPDSIPSDLYKFDFVSPVWSPDLAGLSLLVALIFFATAIVRFSLGFWYKARLG